MFYFIVHLWSCKEIKQSLSIKGDVNCSTCQYLTQEVIVSIAIWVLRYMWLIGSTSASHQCGPGLIPSWESDPSIVSEKGFVPV